MPPHRSMRSLWAPWNPRFPSPQPVNHTPRTWEATVPSQAALNQPPCLPSSSPVRAPPPPWLTGHQCPHPSRKAGQGMQLSGSGGFRQSPESYAGAHAHPTNSTGRIQVWEERWARTLTCVPVISPQSVRDWAPLYFSRAKKAGKGETIQ